MSKVVNTGFIERLQVLIGTKRGDQKRFAARLHVLEGSVIKYLRGSKPTLDFFQKLAEAGFNPNWLISGKGNKHLDEVGDERKYPSLEYRLEAAIPAGTGRVSDYTDWYLGERIDFNEKDVFWLEVTVKNGDSMRPLLLPGDLVLLGEPEKFPAKNADLVAAKWGEEEASIKICHVEKDKVILTSSNPISEPRVFQKEEVRLWKILLIKKVR